MESFHHLVKGFRNNVRHRWLRFKLFKIAQTLTRIELPILKTIKSHWLVEIDDETIQLDTLNSPG